MTMLSRRSPRAILRQASAFSRRDDRRPEPGDPPSRGHVGCSVAGVVAGVPGREAIGDRVPPPQDPLRRAGDPVERRGVAPDADDLVAGRHARRLQVGADGAGERRLPRAVHAAQGHEHAAVPTMGAATAPRAHPRAQCPPRGARAQCGGDGGRIRQPAPAPAALEPVGVGDQRGQRLQVLGRRDPVQPLACPGRRQQWAGSAQHLRQRAPGDRLGAEDEQLVRGRGHRRQSLHVARARSQPIERGVVGGPACRREDVDLDLGPGRVRPHHVPGVAERGPQACPRQGRVQPRLGARQDEQVDVRSIEPGPPPEHGVRPQLARHSHHQRARRGLVHGGHIARANVRNRVRDCRYASHGRPGHRRRRSK